jgi:hypothetical protein
MGPSRLIFKGRVQLPEVLDGGWAGSGLAWFAQGITRQV